MPHQLMRPEVLLVVIFVLWGIAGKLDEPLEGFDPEAASPLSPATGDETQAPVIHLRCNVDDLGEGTARRHAEPLLISAPTSALQASHPSRLTAAIHRDATSRRLTCVVADDD